MNELDVRGRDPTTPQSVYHRLDIVVVTQQLVPVEVVTERATPKRIVTAFSNITAMMWVRKGTNDIIDVLGFTFRIQQLPILRKEVNILGSPVPRPLAVNTPHSLVFRNDEAGHVMVATVARRILQGRSRSDHKTHTYSSSEI